MIGERLNLLPDILFYHRPAVNDLRDFAIMDFSIKFWSTKLGRLLGGSPTNEVTQVTRLTLSYWQTTTFSVSNSS